MKALRDTRFRCFTIAFALFTVADWMSVGLLPILIDQRFESGSTLLTTLVLRLFPRVVIAPFLSRNLLKMGVLRACYTATLGTACLLALLPQLKNKVGFQLCNLLLGALDAGGIVALLTLRSYVLPAGASTSGNTIIQSIRRGAKIISPALVGLLVRYLQPYYGIYVLASVMVIASLLLYRMPLLADSQQATESTSIYASWRKFKAIFVDKPLVWALICPALGYGILLGGLNPFLFFLNKNSLLRPTADWSFLLAINGLGALLGGIIAPQVIRLSGRTISRIQFYLLISLLEVLPCALLSSGWHFHAILVLLFCVGIPEMIAYVLYFDTLQQYLTRAEEPCYYMFSIPLFDFFMILGTLLMESYTRGWLLLQQTWLCIIALATLSILPFLIKFKQYKR